MQTCEKKIKECGDKCVQNIFALLLLKSQKRLLLKKHPFCIKKHSQTGMIERKKIHSKSNDRKDTTSMENKMNMIKSTTKRR